MTLKLKNANVNNVDVNETVVSNKFPFGKQDFKYFIGYKDNTEIRPLCIFFPEIDIYKRYSDNSKCMKIFLINIWQF